MCMKHQLSVYLNSDDLSVAQELRSIVLPGQTVSLSTVLAVCIHFGLRETERLFATPERQPLTDMTGAGPETPPGSEGIPLRCLRCGEWVWSTDPLLVCAQMCRPCLDRVSEVPY